jgi:hypothetical protein
VKQQSRSLFHYTTSQGLFGIIQDRALFATHADFSNDSSECKLISAYLVKTLAAEYEQIILKLIALKVMRRELMRDYGRYVFEREAENSVHSMFQALNNTSPYFIASFCIHDKSDHEYGNGLLSQWPGYARGGFALEFDELELDAMNAEENAGWRYQGLLTNTVSYEGHEALVNPDQFRGMAGAFLRTILRISEPALTDILGKGVVDDYSRPFLSIAPFLKHSGFREENEYRIVALCNRPSKTDPGDKRMIKSFRFRTRPDGNVVPYIALYDGLGKPLPIKGVIIGPHAQQENQRLAVELLLEQHGINAEVRVSETPFR